MANFLNSKVVLFCEQKYVRVNMLPEVPKIEIAKKKILKIERQPSDSVTALNPGFGPGPRSAGYHRQGPGPIFVLRRASPVGEGQELRTRRSRRSLGCVPFLSPPSPSRASAQITIPRDENEIACERSEPPWRHPQPPPAPRTSSSPRPTPRPLSSGSAARAAAPWGCHGEAGAHAFVSFDERWRTRAGPRAGVRRWRRPRRSQWLVATSSRSPPASWASSPASPLCSSTSRYGSHLTSSSLMVSFAASNGVRSNFDGFNFGGEWVEGN